jgi:gliding motility-associated lipoprotein GldH
MNKFLIICTIFCLAACQNHTIYHLYQPVNQTGWGKDDTIHYTFTSPNSSAEKQLEIGIRHKDSYRYRDIWLCIHQSEQIDTVHLYLANKNGNWKGHGFGDMRL